MKKLAILITIIFLLSACTTPTLVDISESEVSLEIDEKNYESELNHEINNYGVPPLYNSLDFDSVDELIDAISDEIIDAVKEGSFHIYAVKTIEEGIEILTGVPAGRKDKNGNFPLGTINYLAYEKLKKFTECSEKIKWN